MKKILLALLNYVDIKRFVLDELLDNLLFKKLDELAASSDNSLDDAVVVMIKPELKKYLEAELDKKLAELKAV